MPGRLKSNRHVRLPRARFGLPNHWLKVPILFPQSEPRSTTKRGRERLHLAERGSEEGAVNRCRVGIVRPGGVPEDTIEFILGGEIVFGEVHPSGFLRESRVDGVAAI